MLKAGKVVSQPSAWGRAEPRTRTTSGCSSSSSKEIGNGSDSEDLPAPSYNTSMSDAIEQALNSIEMRRQSSGNFFITFFFFSEAFVTLHTKCDLVEFPVTTFAYHILRPSNLW